MKLDYNITTHTHPKAIKFMKEERHNSLHFTLFMFMTTHDTRESTTQIIIFIYKIKIETFFPSKKLCN